MTILDDKRYTMSAVAALLCVHIATIWRWVLSGVRGQQLKTVMIGGRRFVLERDLQAFLRAINDGRALAQTYLINRADAAGKILDAKGVKSGREVQ